MNSNYLIDCLMRYDFKPLKLEKGDTVSLMGNSATEVRVIPAPYQGETEKVFIKIGEDSREISKSYVVTPGDTDF